MNSTCIATCKNGNKCKFKAKKDNFCLVHCKTECPICFEHIIDKSNEIVLDCKHIYHRDCITPWIKKNNLTCPYCRTEITQRILNKYHIEIDYDIALREVVNEIFGMILIMEVI
jgi:hypothetical protein